MSDLSTVLFPLPDEDVWINAGEAEYFIPADWIGRKPVVSKCGWWIGEICIVEIEGSRFVDWLYAYSIVD